MSKAWAATFTAQGVLADLDLMGEAGAHILQVRGGGLSKARAAAFTAQGVLADPDLMGEVLEYTTGEGGN